MVLALLNGNASSRVCTRMFCVHKRVYITTSRIKPMATESWFAPYAALPSYVQPLKVSLGWTFDGSTVWWDTLYKLLHGTEMVHYWFVRYFRGTFKFSGDNFHFSGSLRGRPLVNLIIVTLTCYCGEILIIELFVQPNSAFWSHFIVYVYEVKCDQKVETIKSSIVTLSPP